MPYRVHSEHTPAPPEDWVYYCAVFRRTLLAVQRYADTNDRPGMVACGHLAYALHNVPQMLWHYKPGGDWFDSTFQKPLPIQNWVSYQPHLLWKEKTFPSAVVDDMQAIVSPHALAEELELASDFSNLLFPPTNRQRQYLGILYGACIRMRVLANDSPWFRSPWLWPFPVYWSKQIEVGGRTNALFARALQEVPLGLVRWQDFDEARFWRDVHQLRQHVPPNYREAWTSYFSPSHEP